MDGKYITLWNNIYQIKERNSESKFISLVNVFTGNYVRHNFGKIIESKFVENNAIFLSDCTFKYEQYGKYIVLRCTNQNLTFHFVCYSLASTEFVISKTFSKDIIMYKFRLYNNLEDVSLGETFKDNILIFEPNSVKEKKFEPQGSQATIQTNTMSQFYYYQTINKIKERQIQAKASKGDKITVLFVVTYQAKFGMETIYQEMIKSDVFYPVLMIISPKDKIFSKDAQYYNDSLEGYTFFKNHGYNVVFAYNNDRSIKLSIEEINPDIIIFNNPNISQQSIFKTHILNNNYLTCYISYAMCVVNRFVYHYENPEINFAWKNFCPTFYDYQMNIEKSKFRGLNAVNMGYPKLDSYSGAINKDNIPTKLLNGNKVVIIAPHWSYKVSDNLATFHLYCKLFIEMKNKYKNINFVFKPHPDLVNRILSNNDGTLMSHKDYMQYLEDWNKSDNGLYFDGGNYIDLFRYSVAMITDCGSFIGEYLPANKPCIYLVNPEKKNFIEGFNDYGKKILNTYYLAYNKNDIEKFFEQVIVKDEDIYAKKRDDLIKNQFVNIGESGKKIVSYLKNIVLQKTDNI